MKIIPVDKSILLSDGVKQNEGTVCQSYEWLTFLEVNQNVTPVVLSLYKNEFSDSPCAYFVGGIIRKFGFRILGSPFDGWLTPDMGFIRISDFDINEALLSVAKYAKKTLKCWYIQISDKSISKKELSSKIKYTTKNDLFIDVSKDGDSILNSFTKNGRRDVRASGRKGLVVNRVPFDKEFADVYYEQLEEVFAKQKLKPYYNKQKIYDLADAFRDNADAVLALKAVNESGECAGTVLSFGGGKWAYYLCAASFHKHQGDLPNEALFWSFVQYWHDNNIKTLDLVGYRKYKLKYNPQITETPVIYFEKIPGMTKLKIIARKMILFTRSVQGKTNTK